jgi:glycosyltransferase involved in cell wall biosynthesis
MLKILYLLDSEKIGGAERLIENIVRNSSSAPFKPHLLVSAREQNIIQKRFNENNAKRTYFERRKAIDFALIKKIREVAAENEIDIIHANSPVEGIHAHLAGRPKTKIVLSHHGFDFEDKWKDRWARRFLMPRVDANLFPSYVSRDHFLSRYKKINKPVVLKNGVDFRELDKQVRGKTQAALRQKYEIKKTNINLGMIGNFYTAVRDQLTVCRALPEIFQKFPNLHFYFIGGWTKKNPEHYLECYNYCKNEGILGQVHFLGYQKEIANFLQIIDLFVYSTDHDTHALSVSEAIGMGRPVIINDHPCLLEATENGKYTSLFKSKDSEDLSGKIIKILKRGMPKARPQAKNWARRRFSITSHLQNLEKIYIGLKNEK